MRSERTRQPAERGRTKWSSNHCRHLCYQHCDERRYRSSRSRNVDDDQVVVSTTIDPYLTFTLSQNTVSLTRSEEATPTRHTRATTTALPTPSPPPPMQQSGYTITYYGDTLTSGGNSIDAMAAKPLPQPAPSSSVSTSSQCNAKHRRRSFQWVRRCEIRLQHGRSVPLYRKYHHRPRRCERGNRFHHLYRVIHHQRRCHNRSRELFDNHYLYLYGEFLISIRESA